MPLSPGSRLGPYEILAPLGAGGMGEVYRAQDTRLERTVAIKVLPERLWRDEDMRQRFEREAKTISRLSHPHICAVHDVGRQDAVDYLVMEYLEGETLADRLSKGALPFPLALRFAREIADALDCAHRQGIVHRDLKPGNVMLTKEGVKLLDFGLAKAFASAVSGEGFTSVETAARDLTREGTILGTLQYMAPEQLEGKDADPRTDIFALGCVLYEMTTGKKAFSGTSRASLIAAILERQPEPVSVAVPTAPPALDRILRTALAKDPGNRWQSAWDVGLQLDAIGDGPGETQEPETASATAASSRRWKWAAFAGVILFGLSLLLRPRSPVAAAAPTIRFAIAPPPGGEFSRSGEGNTVALSPDGSRIAFVVFEAQKPLRLWQRTLSDLEAHPLEGTEGARSLFWSPDGRSIGFFAEGKLKRLDLSGGAPVEICDLGKGSGTRGIGRAGSWSSRGQILFADVQGAAIFRVSADGGKPEIAIARDPARGETRVVWPWFLADGERFLYMAVRRNGEDGLMLSEPGKKPRGLAAVRSLAQYVDPGYLVFAREGALLGQRFDPVKGQMAGAPFAIAPQVAYFLSTGWAGFATSRNGTIAYQTKGDTDRLVWFDRAGRPGGEIGTPGEYLDLAISPDAKRVLFTRRRAGIGTYDVWVFDLERGVETAVTSDPESEFAGVWLPDGNSILYSAAHKASPRVFLRDLATGRESTLLPEGDFQEALSVSPDGRTVAIAVRPAGGAFEVFTVPLSGGVPAVKLTRPSIVRSERLRFSPDGKAMAYLSTESGREEAYVAPFGRPGERIGLSPDGAQTLCWSRDGREVVYLASDRKLVAVPVRTTPPLEVGRPTTLFRLPEGRDWKDFDLAPDGRILAIVNEVSGDAQPLTVAVNWPAEVRKN
ncbi:MAG: protein kinase [Thermoanaerobaculia bacterium]